MILSHFEIIDGFFDTLFVSDSAMLVLSFPPVNALLQLTYSSIKTFLCKF